MRFIIAILFFIPFGWMLHAQPIDEILVHADQMPYFVGCNGYENGSNEKRACSNQAIVEFIANNIEYPTSAREESIEGTVYISFIIDEQGKVHHPTILRDIGGGCGQEAIRVILNMPTWEPAIHHGRAAKVKLNLPIQFSLKNNNSDEPQLADNYQINWGSLKGNTISLKALHDNMSQGVVVRDELGNAVTINELVFSYEKKNKYFDASSTGRITKNLMKVIKKAKAGGKFTLLATIQEKGEFLYVGRTFTLTE